MSNPFPGKSDFVSMAHMFYPHSGEGLSLEEWALVTVGPVRFTPREGPLLAALDYILNTPLEDEDLLRLWTSTGATYIFSPTLLRPFLDMWRQVLRGHLKAGNSGRTPNPFG